MSNLNEELIDTMASVIMDEIVDQYCETSLADLDDEGVVDCIKNELAFGPQELEETVNDVWEEAKGRVCLGRAWYWEKYYHVTKLVTEAILEQKDTKQAILDIIKDACL